MTMGPRNSSLVKKCLQKGTIVPTGSCSLERSAKLAPMTGVAPTLDAWLATRQHARRFHCRELEMAWAAVMVLDVAGQFSILRELATDIALAGVTRRNESAGRWFHLHLLISPLLTAAPG